MSFKATVTTTDNETILSLEGVVTGGINFERLVGNRPDRLAVDCGRISHVNSSLVKPWLTYFHALRDAGTELRFMRCGPAILEYVNSIPDFFAGGRVESVLAPFICERCKKEVNVTLDTDDFERVRARLKSENCTGCSRPMIFDDNPDEFFQFMIKRERTGNPSTQGGQ